jgi:hypothetical protein
MQISQFKAQLNQGGARNNHFRVNLSFPAVIAGAAGIAQIAQFLCHSTSLPDSTLEDTPVMFRGRQTHLAGERLFNPWTINIYNENNFIIRNAFERWSNAVNNHLDNTGLTSPGDYQVDFSVDQLDRNDNIVKTYKFVNGWPLLVGPIDLDFAANNVIESFPVTFVYDYWTADTITGGVSVSINVNTPIGSLPI